MSQCYSLNLSHPLFPPLRPQVCSLCLHLHCGLHVGSSSLWIPWVCVLDAQSCLILCDPMDCSLPASSVHGILQARILEWIAIPFFRGSSWSRDQTQISCIAGKFFTIWATREAPSIPYICINIRYLSVFYLLHSQANVIDTYAYYYQYTI